MNKVTVATGYAKPTIVRALLVFNGGVAALANVQRPALDPSPATVNGTLPPISGRVILPEGVSISAAAGVHTVTGLPRCKRITFYSVPGAAGQKGSFHLQSQSPESGTCVINYRDASGTVVSVASNSNSVACWFWYLDAGGDLGNTLV